MDSEEGAKARLFDAFAAAYLASTTSARGLFSDFSMV